MNNKTLTSVAQSFSTERVVHPCMLFLLSTASAKAEVVGERVQLGHYTLGTNCKRIVHGATNGLYAKNLIVHDTGNLTAPLHVQFFGRKTITM